MTKVLNTVEDCFDEGEGIPMSFDEVVKAIRANEDIDVDIAYYVQKMYEPLTCNKEGESRYLINGEFEMLHDDSVAFSAFCIYLDTITSKYDVTSIGFNTLADNQTIVFRLHLAKKGE